MVHHMPRAAFRQFVRSFVVAVMMILVGPHSAVIAQLHIRPPAERDSAEGHQLIDRERVSVKYSGLSKDYADAIANIAEATYDYFKDQYHFDMPDRLFIEASLDADNLLGVWNIDDHTIRLSYESERELAPPRRSGVDSVYGLTYRIADLSRERTLGPAPWLTDNASRGLSHLCACHAMDQLRILYGERLWPQPFDYVEHGWRELQEQINRRNAPDIIRAASQWHALESQFGAAAVGDVLATWKRAQISMRRAADDLESALTGRNADSHQSAKLRRWFRGFRDWGVWTETRRARFERSFNSGRLARDAKTLQYDDDTSDGATALPSGGHIVTFQSPPDQWYLTEVQFFARRYGDIPRSGKDFTITLYDEKFKPIASWKKPYGLLRGTEPAWFRIRVPVTRVPSKFVVMLEFDSNKSVGVMMSGDTSSSGHSASGDLRRGVKPVDTADWMVRVEIDRRKDDNPLLYRPE